MSFERHIKFLLERQLNLRNIKESDIEVIKRIEAASYPDFMSMYQDVEDLDEFIDEFDVSPENVKIIIDDLNKWYVIIEEDPVEHEIEVVDMAGNFGLSLLKELTKIFSIYKDWTITGDFRESTSYRLISALEQKGKIDIIHKSKWNWNGETMYDIAFTMEPELSAVNEELLLEDRLSQFVNMLKKRGLNDDNANTLENVEELKGPIGKHLLSLINIIPKDADINSNIKDIMTNYVKYMKSKYNNMFKFKSYDEFKSKVDTIQDVDAKLTKPTEEIFKGADPKLVNQLKNEVDSEGVNKDVELKMLNKFYNELIEKKVEPHKAIEEIGDRYRRFVRTPLVKQDVSTWTFDEFKQAVDEFFSGSTRPTYNPRLFGKPIYEDQNIMIFKADTYEKAMLYSGSESGNPYGLCIGSEGNTYYWSYKAEGKMDYFIYFKNNKAKNGFTDAQFVLLDTDPEGYTLNNPEENDDVSMTKEEIQSKLPVLTDEIFNNILVQDYSISPSDMEVMLKNPDYAYKYARDVLKGQNVPPEIIQSLRNSDVNINKAASYIWNNEPVPSEIIQSISKNPLYAFQYATEVLKNQNVPSDIIQGISKDPYYSYAYAKDILNWQNVPPELIQGISKKPIYSYYYARDVLKGQNVPSEIIQSISKDPGYVYQYAKNVLKGQNVPPEMIQSISKDIYISSMYAHEVLKWKQVPQQIIDTIEKSGKPIPPYATIAQDNIQESFKIRVRNIFFD
jgi:predicted regulator of amino acid metabolism with ACT domain